MMDKFFITFLLIAFLIRTIRNTLTLTFLWQLKEYRFDRFFVHLRETYQGRQLIFGHLSLFKWVLILIFPLTFFSLTLNNFYSLLVLATFIGEAGLVLREIYQKRLRLPIFTFKASFIISVVLFLQFFLLNFPFFEVFFWVLILDKLLPISIAFLVLLLSFPTELVRDKIILEATEKLKKHKNLLVIGVTGSYGKSSTKEFIGQILSFKFKVLKTSGTNNTPIGIAQTVLTGLKDDTEVFVVEMGAYKRGEIAFLCEMVKPKIGVLTGLSFQHLSLFGSFENTLETKYELIKFLPRRGGLAVFNGNNPYCRKLFEKTKIKKLLYSFNKKSDIKVSNIKIDPLSISFRAKMAKQEVNLRVKLLGRHNIENLLPAILIARHLGMDLNEIRMAVGKITYLPTTMRPYRQKSGALFIDDTFNASPDAVLATIEYGRVFKGKRILVLQPMIELGREAGKVHYEIGQVAGKFLTKVFLTNKNFSQEFERGVEKEGGINLVEVAFPDKIASKIKDLVRRGDVVIFEGKEAKLALK